MKKPALEDKEIFNPKDAATFYGMSVPKFRLFLRTEKGLPFTALYGKRKLIIRGEFEKYMAAHPELEEELKSGKLCKKA